MCIMCHVFVTGDHVFCWDGRVPEDCAVREEGGLHGQLHLPAAQHHEGQPRAGHPVRTDAGAGRRTPGRHQHGGCFLITPSPPLYTPLLNPCGVGWRCTICSNLSSSRLHHPCIIHFSWLSAVYKHEITSSCGVEWCQTGGEVDIWEAVFLWSLIAPWRDTQECDDFFSYLSQSCGLLRRSGFIVGWSFYHSFPFPGCSHLCLELSCNVVLHFFFPLLISSFLSICSCSYLVIVLAILVSSNYPSPYISLSLSLVLFATLWCCCLLFCY